MTVCVSQYGQNVTRCLLVVLMRNHSKVVGINTTECSFKEMGKQLGVRVSSVKQLRLKKGNNSPIEAAYLEFTTSFEVTPPSQNKKSTTEKRNRQMYKLQENK